MGSIDFSAGNGGLIFMQKTIQTIAAVGGGASGLAAAISAAQYSGEDTKIVVLERLDRVGKKLLATGNGRCNLENIAAENPSYYFTQNTKALSNMLQQISVQDVLQFFKGCGLLYRQEEEGRIYPSCNQAAVVLDLLRINAQAKGVEEWCNWEVDKIHPQKKGFLLLSSEGESLFAQKVILACGGMAAPKLGGSQKGYELAKALGHTVLPVYPCLTGLCCKGEQFATLKGVRAECGVSLWQGKKQIVSLEGEVQFNEYGVSGYPIMQFSGHWNPKAKMELCFDLVPQLQQHQLESILHQRRKNKMFGQESFLLGLVHKKLATYHLRHQKTNWASPTPQEVSELTQRLKYWTLPISGTPGWDTAQVTGGGVPLQEVQPHSFGSVIHKGLYITGELLDVAGQCGGFNLHWAFSSGILAGRNAAQSIKK